MSHDEKVLTKQGPLEKGRANHCSIHALRTLENCMRRQKDVIVKDDLPRSVGAQYATGVEWINSSRKNEEAEPK